MKRKLYSNVVATVLIIPSILSGGGMHKTDIMEDTYSNHASFYNVEARYSGTDESVLSDIETISYNTKSTDEYFIPGNLPTYYNGKNTSCANVAGAEIIAFYDKEYESLIPNFQVYTKIGSVIKYKQQTSEIDSCIEELYVLMGTDQNGAGTYFAGFQTGMNLYVSNHGGLSYQTESVRKSGNLDFEKYKSAINAGKPVALFMPEYTFAQINAGNGVDSIISHHDTLAHVVAACGYRVDRYYDQSGKIIATKTYVKVASGLIQYGLTYIEVATTIFNEAIFINIE